MKRVLLYKLKISIRVAIITNEEDALFRSNAEVYDIVINLWEACRYSLINFYVNNYLKPNYR